MAGWFLSVIDHLSVLSSFGHHSLPFIVQMAGCFTVLSPFQIVINKISFQKSYIHFLFLVICTTFFDNAQCTVAARSSHALHTLGLKIGQCSHTWLGLSCR